MSLWPQAHRLESERDIIVVTNFGRFWSGVVNETLLLRSGNVQDWVFLYLFLTETCEQHKERLLALVTFCLFFQRVSSLRLFQRRLQLTLNSIYSTYVSLSTTFCGSEYNRNMLWIDVTRNALLWAPYSSVVSHLRPEKWWNKSCQQGFKGYSH